MTGTFSVTMASVPLRPLVSFGLPRRTVATVGISVIDDEACRLQGFW